MSLLLLFLNALRAHPQSIVNTVHNLSVSGPGDLKASTESQVCIFCHTPHSSSPGIPLWNRKSPGLHYTLYKSSTIQASPGQPDGSSILCLSCHDGTIALGSVLSRADPISFSGSSVFIDGEENIGTDLSDDHPISFFYSSGLAASDGELIDPAGIAEPVHLEDQKIQCTGCHDPHDNSIGDFLVVSTRYSELCMYCHQKKGWQTSLHHQSGATWNGSGADPWSHSEYSTVAENACENCHKPHSAEGRDRLLTHITEETGCLDCHSGNVADKNILADLNKTHRHDVFTYTQIHDPEENTVVDKRHVECVDCHNPHAVSSSNVEAPFASGSISGVKGIDSDGNLRIEIQFEYELCYRCHADSPDKSGSKTQRQITENNVRMEYNTSNPSFHPIEGPGRNKNVPSLIAPLDESSIIYCTDCHSSDNSDVRGPHGSIYPPLLKYRYQTRDNTNESFQAYQLCYQCHDRNSIVENSSNEFSEEVHRKHIVDEKTPCNVCHDPHGISGSNNHKHLINFDTSVVSPSQGVQGRLEYIDDGNFSGRCYLYCHRRNHNPKTYN